MGRGKACFMISLWRILKRNLGFCINSIRVFIRRGSISFWGLISIWRLCRFWRAIRGIVWCSWGGRRVRTRLVVIVMRRMLLMILRRSLLRRGIVVFMRVLIAVWCLWISLMCRGISRIVLSWRGLLRLRSFRKGLERFIWGLLCILCRGLLIREIMRFWERFQGILVILSLRIWFLGSFLPNGPSLSIWIFQEILISKYFIFNFK